MPVEGIAMESTSEMAELSGLDSGRVGLSVASVALYLVTHVLIYSTPQRFLPSKLPRPLA